MKSLQLVATLLLILVGAAEMLAQDLGSRAGAARAALPEELEPPRPRPLSRPLRAASRMAVTSSGDTPEIGSLVSSSSSGLSRESCSSAHPRPL